MNAKEYTRKLRRVAAISWVGSLLALLVLAWFEVIPLNEYLPFLALLIGAFPIAVFVKGNRAACESCGGPMKICSGFPRIVFRCRACGKELDTGIYSDY